VQGKVAAGVLSAICEAAEAKFSASRPALLDALALDAEDLREPGLMLPVDALSDLLLFLRDHTQNPGVGLELGFALSDMFDLRAQGFWGYALLSSLTLRQRVEMNIRYQGLRFPAQVSLREKAEVATLEATVSCVSDQALPLLLDSMAALTLTRFLRFFHPRRVVVAASFVFDEQPYHQPLRKLATGPVTFGASSSRFEFPASELDHKLDGDPYLNRLACAELDNHAARTSVQASGEILRDVRERLERRLARDATLERVARDLRISARTLQRKLSELGASFQDLLEEVRKDRAHTYLAETDDPVDDIAARLGYGDPSNFRRAFRRWTGMAPTGFRAQQNAQRKAAASDDRPWRDKPVPRRAR
jgi:AraC-like DNA-binding protein